MPPTLAVIALDLVLIISPSSLILIISGCVISVTILPLGPLANVIGIFDCYFSYHDWIPVMEVSVVHFDPI